MTEKKTNVPLNLFGVSFGILGLADAWLVAAQYGLAPAGIGRALVAAAMLAWAVVLVLNVRGKLARGVKPFGDLADPVLGPFASLAVITPMLASADALYPYSHMAGTAVVDVLAVVTLLLGGWFIGEWIYRPLDLPKVHPGYFLPSVAGGLVASASMSLVGQTDLATLMFGAGMLSWLVVGSIVLGRMILGPPLPGPLTPTIAIEVAPAGVATFAAFAMNGGRVDLLVKLLAAYGVLMIAAQLRLLPVYLRLRFMPSFWSFTFSWAAVAFAGESWLGVTRPAGWRIELWALLALITLFVGAIAVRTLVALRRGQLLPAAPPASAAPAAPSTAAPVAAVPVLVGGH